MVVEVAETMTMVVAMDMIIVMEVVGVVATDCSGWQQCWLLLVVMMVEVFGG